MIQTPVRKPRYTQQLLDIATEHAEKSRCSATELSAQFGISDSKAKEICKIIAGRLAASTDERKRAINQARAFANRNVVGHAKLTEMFGLSVWQAKNVATCAASKRKKRNDLSRINQDAARAFLMDRWKDATTAGVARQFGLGIKTAQKIVAEVRAIMVPKPEEPKRRTVRRFIDLSGTDATSDRRRYPSGVGFGVELVR